MNRRFFLASLFGLPFVKKPDLRIHHYSPYIPLQFPNHARVPSFPITFKRRYDINNPTEAIKDMVRKTPNNIVYDLGDTIV